MKNLLNISTALLIITSALAQAPDSVLRELLDDRTYFSKTYYNTRDNTYVTRVSAGYEHYLASDGRFKDIDTNLKLDKSGTYYVIDTGLYNVAFAAAIGAGNWDVAYEVPRPVHEKFRDPGKPPAPVTRVRWKVLSYGYWESTRNRYQIIDYAKAVAPVVSRNSISYPQIFNGIDARYLCQNTSVKEEIILSHSARKELPDPAKYDLSRNNSYFVVAMEFLLTPNNINVFAQRQGNKTPIKQGNDFVFNGDEPIAFEDADSTLHFFFPRDYAHAVADSTTDFANRTSIKRIFYSQGGKNYMLVGVPWSWLNSSPQGDLIVDPTTTVTSSNDTYLQDATNYGSSTSLIIGKSSGTDKKRTIIKFNISGVPYNAMVLNAQMKLRYYGTTGSTWVDRWVQAHELLLIDFAENETNRDGRTVDLEWYLPYAAIDGRDAKAQYESTVLFQTGEIASWKNWDLTALTQKWVSNSTTNFGVILWATNEDTDGMNLWFRSSEYTTDPTVQPKLEIIWSQTPQTVYFLKDHLGSIRATVLDSAIAPVIAYDDYDPWGYPLATRTQPIPNAYLQGASKNKFTGKERDDDYSVNLDYFGARYYDWLIGRWTSVDPMWQKHPDVTPYNYVLNNPLRLVDPDGMQVSAIEMRFLRDPALGGLYQSNLKAYQQGERVGAGVAAGALVVGAAATIAPYATAAALSNPVTTNEIGIGITEALSPGAENLGVRGIPYGFESGSEFKAFGSSLLQGLETAGFNDVKALFQGSSVTGKKLKTGEAFDVGRISDFDIAISSSSLFAKAKELGIALRSGGTRTGPLKAADLKKLGLDKFVQQLYKKAGRPVNFMIFESAEDAAERAPSILVQ